MKYSEDQIVSMEEAVQDFEGVARIAEEKGRVVVLKGSRPKLLIIDLDREPQLTEDELFEVVALRILKENRRAFEELAK